MNTKFHYTIFNLADSDVTIPPNAIVPRVLLQNFIYIYNDGVPRMIYTFINFTF